MSTRAGRDREFRQSAALVKLDVQGGAGRNASAERKRIGHGRRVAQWKDRQMASAQRRHCGDRDQGCAEGPRGPNAIARARRASLMGIAAGERDIEVANGARGDHPAAALRIGDSTGIHRHQQQVAIDVAKVLPRCMRDRVGGQ
ncbi:hypothetical protein [Aquimonas voraii]|uniref:hypothetical protein n=1 Tax=Aquimonas voraii TaxID=265719 RepID=UPI00115FBCF3|nr:hypothetical protein [Aquimonas voraii]